MPDQTLQTPDQPDGLTPTGRTGPASLAVTLHVSLDQVRVQDLSNPTGRTSLHDLVSLQLGDEYAKVSVLGTLDEIVAILEAGTAGARQVVNDRKAAGR